MDRNRFADLMRDSPADGDVDSVKYPQIVSFIGETGRSSARSAMHQAKDSAGAGKSTLVKTLIKRHIHGITLEQVYSTPIVGTAANDRQTTSSDVHLYADPLTAPSAQPALYADCEGLQGGEIAPVATTQTRPRAGSGSKMKVPAARLTKGKIRGIPWATDDMKRKREYMVHELYPRLLYTFSDVIVFVLRNAR